MVGGLASIAGSILAGYVALGVDINYLIAASFMVALGGLLFAKLMKPEVDIPHEGNLGFAEGDDKPANVVDAAAVGASTGLKLALNVGAMLLAFIGLIALFNVIIGGIGGWFGSETLSLQMILGWCFAPIAWLIGMPWEDTLSPKARAIGAVALCGFANLSSIGILLGGLGAMAPNRRSEIAKLGFKALIAGTFPT
jgi:CNT family concentrative nucleoside transporter